MKYLEQLRSAIKIVWFWLTQWHMTWVTTHLILSLIIKHTLKISLFTSHSGNLYLQARFPHHQFSLVTQSCPTLCNPMDGSVPSFPVHHQLLELTQTHVHWVSDSIQPSHPLSSPSPPTFSLSQHQGLFQWVNSSHQVAKILEFQLHHQSFQWIFRTDFLLDGLVRSPRSSRDSQ